MNGSEPGTLIRWGNDKKGSWRGAKGNRAGQTGELFDRRFGGSFDPEGPKNPDGERKAKHPEKTQG